MSRKVFARLSSVMESVKAQDAARLKEAQSAIAALDERREALKLELAATQAGLAPDDLQSSAAFERFRALQLRRLEALAEERRALEVIEEERRQALLRSNGEVEAMRRLATPERKIKRNS